MNNKKLFLSMALFAGLGLVATGCDQNTDTSSSIDDTSSTHEHTYSTDWSSDAEYHWHAPTCGDTTEVKDKAAHTFEGGVCTVCGYQQQVVTTYRDVTITVTASGIDEYSGNHAYLWINTSIGATVDEADSSKVKWSTTKMTQKGESDADKNVWSVTFTNVETDQNYDYNIYFGGEEAPDWDNGKNTEHTGDTYFTITVTDDNYQFEQAVTFVVPTEKYSFRLVVTPYIKSSADAEPVALADTTNVYMWCSVANDTVLTKGDNGTWYYDVADYTGSVFSATPCLGLDSINWSYQYGDYKNGEWETWDKYSWDINAETTTLELTAYFKAEPVAPTEGAKKVTFVTKCTENVPSSASVLVSTTASFTSWSKGDASWNAMTANDDKSEWSITLDYDEGTTIYFMFYGWFGTGTDGYDDNRYIAADTENGGNAFTMTVSADATVTNSVNFGDTQYGVVAGSIDSSAEQDTAKKITFVTKCTENVPSSAKVLVSTTASFTSWDRGDASWDYALTANDDKSEWSTTIDYDEGTKVYFMFYGWFEVEGDWNAQNRFIGATASEGCATAFELTVTADATITNTVDFGASSGVAGSLA